MCSSQDPKPIPKSFREPSRPQDCQVCGETRNRSPALRTPQSFACQGRAKPDPKTLRDSPTTQQKNPHKSLGPRTSSDSESLTMLSFASVSKACTSSNLNDFLSAHISVVIAPVPKLNNSLPLNYVHVLLHLFEHPCPNRNIVHAGKPNPEKKSRHDRGVLRKVRIPRPSPQDPLRLLHPRVSLTIPLSTTFPETGETP